MEKILASDDLLVSFPHSYGDLSSDKREWCIRAHDLSSMTNQWREYRDPVCLATNKKKRKVDQEPVKAMAETPSKIHQEACQEATALR